jgi:hypothetical protein
MVRKFSREHVILKGGTSYLMLPANHGFSFEEDMTTLSVNNKYLSIGVHKSMRYVEGSKGRGHVNMGLIVEGNVIYNLCAFPNPFISAKKTPFHLENVNLWQKTRGILNLPETATQVEQSQIAPLERQLKGLCFFISFYWRYITYIHNLYRASRGCSLSTKESSSFHQYFQA